MKTNFVFGLLSTLSLTVFVYLYLSQPPVESRIVEDDKTVEIIDFSKPKEARTQRYSTEAPNKKELIYGGQPKRTTYPNRIRVLENKGFVVGYDEKRKNPAWVAYKISDCSGLCHRGLKRPKHFDVDYRTRARVKPSDYSRSGYDRGHMAPNHAISTRYGKEAQNQSFLMSNITPQKKSLNGGVWREIEHRVADIYAKKLEDLWVITGPIYKDELPDKFLKNGTEIPDAFYKIIIDEVDGKPRAMAFIIPQNAYQKEKPKSFLVSVDEVEEQAGLDFLYTTRSDDVLESQSITF